MRSLGLRAIVIATLLAGCRRPVKPNVLAYVPENAPVVAWLPQPEASLDAVATFLQTFDGSTVGQQLKLLRADVQRQLGVDPLDAKTFADFGIDVSQPWAVAADATGVVFLLAAHDPSRFLARFTELMEPIAPAKTLGRVHVFSQPFGNVQLEQYAMRLGDKAVLLTVGDGGAERLKGWPERDAQNFQKFWKRAGPDGSLPGAVLRIYARDTQRLLPPALADALGPNAELRSALTVTAHRAELFTTVFGVSKERLAGLVLDDEGRQPGIGLADKSVLFARSALHADKVHRLVRELQIFAPLVAGIDATLGPDTLESLVKLSSGEAALAIEMDASQLQGRDRLRALLDAFPISATAKLTGDLEAMLPMLHAKLKAHGVPAVVDGGKLKASTLSPRSQATLGKQGDRLVYAIGPGAFDRLLGRLQKKEGISSAVFEPLLAPQTSGVIVDLHSVLQNSKPLLALLLGEQGFDAGGSVMRSVFARTLDSFAHLHTLGLTLHMEGPALEPHPVVRVWLTTQ